MISADFPYKKRRIPVLCRMMAVVEVGEGDPIVLLHGNPTSSYIWRNVIPHIETLGRCIAPDLVGMGDSDKLPDSGPGSYTFREHRSHLDETLNALDVRENVTLVVHDWGSALGFDWARRHPESVRGISYMEALVRPTSWVEFPDQARELFQALRSPAGETMVLEPISSSSSCCPEASHGHRAMRRWTGTGDRSHGRVRIADQRSAGPARSPSTASRLRWWISCSGTLTGSRRVPCPNSSSTVSQGWY